MGEDLKDIFSKEDTYDAQQVCEKRKMKIKKPYQDLIPVKMVIIKKARENKREPLCIIVNAN